MIINVLMGYGKVMTPIVMSLGGKEFISMTPIVMSLDGKEFISI